MYQNRHKAHRQSVKTYSYWQGASETHFSKGSNYNAKFAPHKHRMLLQEALLNSVNCSWLLTLEIGFFQKIRGLWLPPAPLFSAHKFV